MNSEPEDFESFYERTRDGCLRAIYVSVGDMSLAEDLTAEGFAKAFADWRKLHRHPAPQAWVVRVALNTHVSWWRKRRHEVTWPEQDEAFADRLGQADPGPPGLDTAVLAAVRTLPTRQQQVVTLRLLLDLDTETTARVLGIASGTVKFHLSRAAAALRVQLAPVIHEEPAQ